MKQYHLIQLKGCELVAIDTSPGTFLLGCTEKTREYMKRFPVATLTLLEPVFTCPISREEFEKFPKKALPRTSPFDFKSP
jgi:hypothetical protein